MGRALDPRDVAWLPARTLPSQKGGLFQFSMNCVTNWTSTGRVSGQDEPTARPYCELPSPKAFASSDDLAEGVVSAAPFEAGDAAVFEATPPLNGFQFIWGSAVRRDIKCASTEHVEFVLEHTT
jgi:hypothetical protein